MDVGFIGLGAMGSAMARNLIKAGHTVRVWNRSPEPMQALVTDGAIAAASPAETADADAVFSMLADDAAVRSVVADGGLLDAPRPGLVHVGCSTISVALAQEIAQIHAERTVSYISAPVFGRPDAAAAGRLNFVAAGPASALERIRPLLDILGAKIWSMGDEPFKANLVKIAGNLMIASAIEAMAEATALGKAHGVEARAMLDVYLDALFPCRIYTGYAAAIAERRYEPAGFKLKLGFKDVRLALQAGDAANVPLPFGSALRDAFLGAMAGGDGDKDWSALADVALERAGLGEG